VWESVPTDPKLFDLNSK